MKWISVEDKMPQFNDAVLVSVKRKKGGRVLFAFYFGHHRFILLGKRNPEKEVTHWMPLPSPAGEGEEV